MKHLFMSIGYGLAVAGLALGFSIPAAAQGNAPGVAVLSSMTATDSLPAAVRQQLLAAPRTISVFSVSGTESFKGQILKADEIVFGEGSTLILEATDAPWIIISTRSLKFARPQAVARIRFARAPGKRELLAAPVRTAPTARGAWAGMGGRVLRALWAPLGPPASRRAYPIST